MPLSFEGPAVFVSDMTKARAFYEGVLGQEVLFSVTDSYVAYASKFSLWHAGSANAMIHEESNGNLGRQGKNNFEMYFEDTELDYTWIRIEALGLEVVHGIKEMPWGQRCFRILDPDGHIVEIGEPMGAVIQRLLGEGLDAEEVARRTMAPLQVVKKMADEEAYRNKCAAPCRSEPQE